MKRNVRKHFQKGDRDANESEITAVLKAANEPYSLLPTGFGADIIGKSNPMYWIEVKTATGKLTEVEKALKWDCEQRGIEYYILRTGEETAAMLALRTARAELNRASPMPEREG